MCSDRIEQGFALQVGQRRSVLLEGLLHIIHRKIEIPPHDFEDRPGRRRQGAVLGMPVEFIEIRLCLLGIPELLKPNDNVPLSAQ